MSSDKRFVLGVDLDGVLGDYLTDIWFAAADWLGVKLDSLPDPDYEFKNWGVDNWPGGYGALHKYAVTKRGLFLHMDPMKDAPQVLRRLSDANVRIRIITSRLCIKYHHEEAVTQTVKWLEKHDIPYWDLCFVKDKTSVHADLYLDDSSKNVEALREAGKNVLIYDNCTNQHIDGPRVKGWLEVERIVNEKLKTGEWK